MTMNVFTNFCCIVLYWMASTVTADEKKNTLKPNGLPNSNEFLTMSQKLDHFLFTRIATRWEQRYVINDQHYKSESAKVFLIVGGQKQISISDVTSGVYFEYAKSYNALLICVEHRFFGGSEKPITTDLSTGNLSYLNSEQVLADLAMFIAKMKQTYAKGIPSNSKWVAFGTGYAGTLAVRLRLKYPHLVLAAVSSGSRFLEIPEFSKFYNHLSLVYGQNVSVYMRNGFKELLEILKSTRDDKAILKEKFNLCDELTSNRYGEDEEFLVWTIANLLGLTLDHGNFLLEDRDEIRKTIIHIMETSSLELNNLAKSVNHVLTKSMKNFEGSDQNTCLLANYQKAVNMYRKSSWDYKKLNIQLFIGLGDRQSLYQKCFEFGQFETSEWNSMALNEIKFEFFLKLCSDVFGDTFDLDALHRGIARNIMIYGGLNIQVMRAIFVYGGRDPFSQLGVTQAFNLYHKIENVISVKDTDFKYIDFYDGERKKRDIQIKHKMDNRFVVYDEDSCYLDDMKIDPKNPRFNFLQRQIKNILNQWFQYY